MPTHRVFVGTYTDPTPQAGYPVTPERPVMGMTGRTGSTGIYTFAHDSASGDWTPLGQTEPAAVVNPSFLALSPDEQVLFAVNETREFAGQPTGAVSSFAVDAATGTLRRLSQMPSGGGNPCHLTVAAAGRLLLVTNHEAATVAVLPIDEAGRLGAPVDVVHDPGEPPAGSRRPHTHFVTSDPERRYILTTNTGTDRVRVFRLETTPPRLVPNDPPWGQTHAGGSPRHLAFHPGGRYLFANGEADLTLSVFRYDADTGTLTYLGHEPTVPPGVTGQLSTAQILAHPNGRTVYVSNRGHDSIAVFAFDAATGQATRITTVPIGGRTPRNFALDPTGSFLYVAGQNSGTIVRFRVDEVSGQLSHPYEVATVPAPTCILFTER